MNTRVVLSALASFLSAVAPCAAEAGVITFAGDLAGNLSARMTPMVIGAGVTREEPFDSGVIAGLGRVQGKVVFRNNATATASDITITDLVFESDRPANTGLLGFNMTIIQSFAWGGPATLKAKDSISGTFTFTASPQSGSAALNAAVEGVDFAELADSANAPGAGFPANDPLGPKSNMEMEIAADGPILASMSLSMVLSDNALGMGPRITLPHSAYLTWAAPDEDFLVPIPEPAPVALLGAGLFGLAALGRRRRV